MSMENMDPNAMVRALEKLLDYTASGIGAVVGPMLAPWQARREAAALQIAARGEANALRIIAAAQAEARDALVSTASHVGGEIDIAKTIRQRIQFQEDKRHRNIGAVVGRTAELLGEKEVPNQELDHDWTARFFNYIQDVSSDEMQLLWGEGLGRADRATWKRIHQGPEHSPKFGSSHGQAFPENMLLLRDAYHGRAHTGRQSTFFRSQR